MIPEDLCAIDWSTWADFLPVLGPLGALVLAVIGVELWRKRRKRSTSVRWASRPIKVEHPTDREVKAHDEAVEDLESKATEAGPHVEASPVTDEEIDDWARGE